jgi:hypothetical protein
LGTNWKLISAVAVNVPRTARSAEYVPEMAPAIPVKLPAGVKGQVHASVLWRRPQIRMPSAASTPDPVR